MHHTKNMGSPPVLSCYWKKVQIIRSGLSIHTCGSQKLKDPVLVYNHSSQSFEKNQITNHRTTRSLLVLSWQLWVLLGYWETTLTNQCFFFSFLVLKVWQFSPPINISGPIFTLKRGKFPNFSKKLLSLGAENSPKKITVTNSSFYSVLFQRTNGSSLVLKSFK